MSTTAIREALGAAGMAAPDTNNEALARTVAAAWAEVEAIERAARAVAVAHSGKPLTTRECGRHDDAVDFLCLLAETAPK